ncbi:glycosyltransferase family 4 protein [Crocosphaera watsonii]|nr:glycosyltransferase family 4 protein [Crocosphaera watsonii]CCQ70079.1 hypothetical protein CWATWH0402_2543 [Crocosphaera watsonii WH 0402]
MGTHSGYDQLCESMYKILPDNTYKSVWQRPGQPQKKIFRSIVERVGKKAKASPMYALDSTTAEIKTIVKSLRWHPSLIHITYVENQLGILQNWKGRLACKIIGTSHQPAGWWRLVHRNTQNLANLDALIVVGSREVEYFEKYLPGKVFFIPHGVDTDFFCPSEEKNTAKDTIRCVFSGQYLRDMDTLSKVVDNVLSMDKSIQFDLIFPRKRRNMKDPTLMRLARHEQVHWYADISEKRLREIYRNARLLILPFIHCTANNSLLEAIACGLPVVSNDVGSIRDYAKDEFADLLPPGDADGMTEAIFRLINNPEEARKRGQAARLFAEKHLNWEIIANQTMSVYNKIIEN